MRCSRSLLRRNENKEAVEGENGVAPDAENPENGTVAAPEPEPDNVRSAAAALCPQPVPQYPMKGVAYPVPTPQDEGCRQ